MSVLSAITGAVAPQVQTPRPVSPKQLQQDSETTPDSPALRHIPSAATSTVSAGLNIVI